METFYDQMPKLSNALAKTIGHRNFDPAKYVKSVSAQSDGDKDLEEEKHRVQSLGEDTAQILKKQVYKYYQQFIDTAKEISYVEGEMFQLQHILTEQKNLMKLMSNIYLVKDDEEREEHGNKKQHNTRKEDKKRVMMKLREKVEGFPDPPNHRFLVYDNDVTELEMDNFSEIRKIHLFLFNDSLILTAWAGMRRGQLVPGKYKFLQILDLKDLAVINARDVGPVKNAFKVMGFLLSDTVMFQCENSKEKREWLDILEETKKKFLADQVDGFDDTPLNSPLSPTLSGANPFETNPFDTFSSSLNLDARLTSLQEVWILEMPEDLDVFIAQRNFEEAVDLIGKAEEYFRNNPTAKDMEKDLQTRKAQLVSVLVKELGTAPDRSHRGGPTAARRPVSLLTKLGESTKACHLFLDNRSNAVSYALRQIRAEGYLGLYITKLCNVFFTGLKDTMMEFELAFNSFHGCYSKLVVWAHTEMNGFVDMVAQQIFTRRTDISEIADCASTICAQCKTTNISGMDFEYTITSLLLPDIETAIKDHRSKVVDAIKLRSSEELWRPTNCGNPQTLLKLQEEMEGYGITNIYQYSYNDCFCHLTNSTLCFTRALIVHVDSVVKMYLPELQVPVLDGIETIERCYTEFIAGCLISEKERPEKAKLIKRNAMFVAESLLPLVESKIQRCILQLPKQLADLRIDFIKRTSD